MEKLYEVSSGYVDTRTFTNSIRVVAAAACVYGVYWALYPLSLWILLTRRRGAYRLYTVMTSCLFVLGTVVFACLVRIHSFASPSLYNALYATIVVCTICAGVLAESIIIHRWYCIWDYRKRVLVLPCMLYMLCLAFMLFCVIRSKGVPFGSDSISEAEIVITFSSSSTANTIVTLMSAGRIWWLGRQAKMVYGDTLRKRCNIALNMTLESGLFFTACSITACYFLSRDGHVLKQQTTALGSTPLLWLGIIPLIAGIIPTLLNVLVSLGMDSSSMRSSSAGEILMTDPNRDNSQRDEI